jgi:hypothetical protein
MLRIIFTLDYEIHGNGDGNPQGLMIEPTYRLLRLCDEYGAKVTIMADVAEILKFKEYKDKYGRDDYCYDAIVDQLCYSIKKGHDVQLHIHPSYFNARHDGQRWAQDWSEYSFADLPYERMIWMVKTSKDFLEFLLTPSDPSYRCNVFRAANWSVSPSTNIVRALVENDIRIDTSVFKYGYREGIVNFNYSSAHHPLLPWPANQDDICCYDHASPLWEFPIYSENRWVGAFVTPSRMYRALVGRLHRVSGNFSTEHRKEVNAKAKKSMPFWLFKKIAWKADFNQCSAGQLVRALHRAEKQVETTKAAPFVLIGHSKLFSRRNEFRIRRLLTFVEKRHHRFSFGTFRDFCCQVAPENGGHSMIQSMPT